MWWDCRDFLPLNKGLFTGLPGFSELDYRPEAFFYCVYVNFQNSVEPYTVLPGLSELCCILNCGTWIFRTPLHLLLFYLDFPNPVASYAFLPRFSELCCILYCSTWIFRTLLHLMMFYLDFPNSVSSYAVLPEFSELCCILHTVLPGLSELCSLQVVLGDWVSQGQQAHRPVTFSYLQPANYSAHNSCLFKQKKLQKKLICHERCHFANFVIMVSAKSSFYLWKFMENNLLICKNCWGYLITIHIKKLFLIQNTHFNKFWVSFHSIIFYLFIFSVLFFYLVR